MEGESSDSNLREGRASMRASFMRVIAAAALGVWLNPGAAQADPDEFIECRLAIIKAPPAGSAGQGYSKFVCRGTFTLPSAGAAPSGSGFRIGLNPGPPGFVFPPSDLAFTFCSGLGNPPGSRGY